MLPLRKIPLSIALWGIVVLSGSAQELFWKNGDRLNGKILNSEPGFLKWKSTDFVEPFEIETRTLEKIVFSKTPDIPADPLFPFLIHFQNGDNLPVDIISIKDQKVFLRSPIIPEEIVAYFAAIHRIERIDGSTTNYLGLADFKNWKILGAKRDGAPWNHGTSGYIEKTRFSGEIFRDIPLPEKTEISFRVSCSNLVPLNFEIGLFGESTTGPRIETWDDTLVLTDGKQFAAIQKTSDIRETELRIFRDKEKREITICDFSGKILARLENTEVIEDSPSGFRLKNGSTKLRLSRLIVRQWDGKTIHPNDAKLPRLTTTKGEERQLSAEKFESMSEIDRIEFSQGMVEAEDACRLDLQNGHSISGNLAPIEPESIGIKPPWMENKLTIAVKGVETLNFPESKIAEHPCDRVQIGQVNLKGQMMPGKNGNPQSLLSWQPVGSKNASPFATSQFARFSRPDSAIEAGMIEDSRLYLMNNEVIPVKLISIDEENIKFTSNITGESKIPHRSVRFIDIDNAAPIPAGFGDRGWKTLPPKDQPDAVKMDKDRVVFKEGGFGHLNLLGGDLIRFRAEWKDSNYGVFTVRLFCENFENDSPATSLLIGLQGNRLLVGQLRHGGGFNFTGKQIFVKESGANIEILTDSEQIDVRIDGTLALTTPVNPIHAPGKGMQILMGGGWKGWNDNLNKVEISNCSVTRTTGFLGRSTIKLKDVKEVDDGIKILAGDKPTPHLLITKSQDLLQGTLTSLKEGQIHFSSGGKEYIFPDSLVAAIVWTHTALKKTEFQETHQVTLQDGSLLKLVGEDITKEGVFTGRSEILGLCRFRLSSASRITQQPRSRN